MATVSNLMGVRREMGRLFQIAQSGFDVTSGFSGWLLESGMHIAVDNLGRERCG